MWRSEMAGADALMVRWSVDGARECVQRDHGRGVAVSGAGGARVATAVAAAAHAGSRATASQVMRTFSRWTSSIG